MALFQTDHPAKIPESRITRLSRPLVSFMHISSASGIVLALCTVVALVAANTGIAEAYAHFWHTKFTIGFDGFQLSYDLHYWVNEALMTIFFFVVGLEIKRELVSGELREPRKVVLPVAAAAGGAVLPALIYFGFISQGEAAAGWAIPMATDIAFVVGFLALLGDRVPPGLKIMLLTLAIVDDIMAVIVIALFYSAGVSYGALAGAMAGFLAIVALRRLGVRTLGVYVVLGFVIWVFMLYSGIHPTVAGVFLGMMTPATAYLPHSNLQDVMDNALDWLRGDRGADAAPGFNFHRGLQFYARETISPLERLETMLHPWVAFGIMPIFALANAGVPISADAFADPVAVAVSVGLVLGKPVGIFLTSFLAVRLGMAALPQGVNWLSILGGGCLAGIGFTMSLFIAGLAFKGDLLNSAKAGVLLGSTISAVMGLGLLVIALRQPKQTA